MSLKLHIENYRGLRSVDCTFPSGLSVVVGPNGAGKTTLLKVPELFRHAYERGWSKALEHHGGLHQYKHVGAPPEELVRLRIERGDLRWEVDFSGTVDSTVMPSEEVLVAGQRLGTRYDSGEITLAPNRQIGRLAQSVLRLLVDRGEVGPASLAQIPDMRCYSDFFAYRLRENGSQYSADTHLHPTGLNVLTVLRNWKDKLATRPRQEFVIEALREAFPGFVDLEFEATSNVVEARVVSGAFDQATSLRTAANGFIHAMMCLTGVASAPPGGLMTIDEPETALHPFAIRRVLEAMRDWSNRHAIDVILATHSPVVIDTMHETPEQVLVFSPADGPGPRPLPELRDRTYLARFSVGELYVDSRLGGPVGSPRAASSDGSASAFFGEPAAVTRALDAADAPRVAWSTNGPSVEEFATSDAAYLDRVLGPDLPMQIRRGNKTVAWRAENRERHPKHYVELLCRGGPWGYREGKAGVAALQSLVFAQVLAAGAPLLAAMLGDIEDALGLPRELGAAAAPRVQGVLRSL